MNNSNTDNSDAAPHVTDQEQLLKDSVQSEREEQSMLNFSSKNSETSSDFPDSTAVAVTSETSESTVESANDKANSDISQETGLGITNISQVASEVSEKSDK
jgi:translation initiation factor 4G